MSVQPESNQDARGERAAVFAVTAAIVLAYALRGGTYDLVARGEAGILAWWLLGLGILAGVLPRARFTRTSTVVVAGLAGLLIWTGIAFSWTESDERTSIELARVAHHLGVFLLFACVIRRRTAGAAIAGLATAAALVCVLAVGSRLYPGSFPVDRIRESFGGNRLSYPLNYWNAVAAWGAMAAAMALAWSTHARTWPARALALGALPACATATYLSYSRAGAAGIVLGAILVLAASRTRLLTVIHIAVAAASSYLVIHAIRQHEPIVQATGTEGRGSVLAMLILASAVCAAVATVLGAFEAEQRLGVPRRPARIATIAGAAVLVVAAVLLLPHAISRGWDEFRSDSSTTTASADPAARLGSLNGNRYNTFASAVETWKAHPGEGTGPGTFEFSWSRDARNAESVRDAHSLYLESLSESGWPGLLFVLLVVGGGLAIVIARRMTALSRSEAGAATAAVAGFGLYAFHAGVDWMWEETAVTVVGLVLVAACATTDRPSGVWRLRTRLPVTMLCLVAILLQLPPVIGTSKVRESQRAYARGDVPAAQAAAADAISAWPWAASPFAQRALLAEAGGQNRAALVDAQRAVAREPTNWRRPLLVARLQARLGHPAKALDAFRQARRLRPLAAVFR